MRPGTAACSLIALLLAQPQLARVNEPVPLVGLRVVREALEAVGAVTVLSVIAEQHVRRGPRRRAGRREYQIDLGDAVAGDVREQPDSTHSATKELGGAEVQAARAKSAGRTKEPTAHADSMTRVLQLVQPQREQRIRPGRAYTDEWRRGAIADNPQAQIVGLSDHVPLKQSTATAEPS